MKSRVSSRCFSILAPAFSVFLLGLTPANPANPVWPPAPDSARVAYSGELNLQDLKPQSGFLGKLGRALGGGSRSDQIGHPFDVVRAGDRLFLTCQNIPALIEVRMEENTFVLHECKELPPRYPIGLCLWGDSVLLTDSEQGVVYRFQQGKLAPFITQGLERPTGLAVVQDRLFVVDTAAHAVKLFDREGNDLGVWEFGLHYPTFAASAGEEILINDSLNYRIRRVQADGRELGAFGKEGDGPGSFARPKDLAVDSQGHIYVVDTLFDNIQVFDPEGRLLLVIGGQGNGPGEFWSPGGIDIVENTLYVADTYNHRIQILRYLGGSR